MNVRDIQFSPVIQVLGHNKFYQQQPDRIGEVWQSLGGFQRDPPRGTGWFATQASLRTRKVCGLHHVARSRRRFDAFVACRAVAPMAKARAGRRRQRQQGSRRSRYQVGSSGPLRPARIAAAMGLVPRPT